MKTKKHKLIALIKREPSYPRFYREYREEKTNPEERGRNEETPIKKRVKKDHLFRTPAEKRPRKETEKWTGSKIWIGGKEILRHEYLRNTALCSHKEKKEDPDYGYHKGEHKPKIQYRGANIRSHTKIGPTINPDGSKTLSKETVTFEGNYSVTTERTVSGDRRTLTTTVTGANLPVIPRGYTARNVGGTPVTFKTLSPTSVNTKKYKEAGSSAGYLPQMCHIIPASLGLPQTKTLLANLFAGSKHINTEMGNIERIIKEHHAYLDEEGDMRVPHLEVTVTQTHPTSERGEEILSQGIEASAENYEDYGQGAERLASQTDRKIKVWETLIKTGIAWPTERIDYNISGTTYTIGQDTVLYLDRSKTKPQFGPTTPAGRRDPHLQTPTMRIQSDRHHITPFDKENPRQRSVIPKLTHIKEEQDPLQISLFHSPTKYNIKRTPFAEIGNDAG